VTPIDPESPQALIQLAVVHPRLGAVLQQSEQQRIHTVAALTSGARFKGLDELLRHFDELERAFAADSECSKLAFLISRCVADFETAFEATVSGYLAVASDAMRDVMEIENLLLDFATHPDHVDEWLAADQKTLRKKFGPAEVRARLHAAGVGRYATTAESLDYRAHSAALHVTPHQHPVAAKGFSTEQGWNGDAGFWEIFEHARRLRLGIQSLTSALHPGSALVQLTGQDLDGVSDAHRRTQEMQAIYLAILQASTDTQTKDGDGS
jgi:hypothetical protein